MTVQTRMNEGFSGLLKQLDAIYPLLQSEAADSERLRRPTPMVQDALRDSGVFTLMVPAELGGMEASPLQILQVMEKLSHADSSLGWLVRAVASETAAAATYLGDEAVTELFTKETFPLVAGQSTSFTGQAVREDGGYRVSGVWQFAAGVSMATHLNLAVTVQETGERLVCLVPRAALRISDNWDMLGLRATASLDYRAEDLLVKDTYVFRPGPEHTRRGRSLQGLSPALLAGLHQAAWSQGVGRRMLDELRELTQRKDPAAGPRSPVTSSSRSTHGTSRTSGAPWRCCARPGATTSRRSRRGPHSTTNRRRCRGSPAASPPGPRWRSVSSCIASPAPRSCGTARCNASSATATPEASTGAPRTS